MNSHRCFLTLILAFNFYFAAAQNAQNNNLIAASQGEASAIFFNMAAPSVKPINVSSFTDAEEFKVRNGLPNFLEKAKAGKKLIVAYLGGSITRSNQMYRLQSAQFIQHLFPATPMEGINAGISGTDADLGAARFHEQVLKYNPDLVFVEFAVNGAFAPGVEGIIRKAKKYNPKIDICLIYTATSDQLKEYENGSIPFGIQGLERIADHYGITSIHLAKEAAALAKGDQLLRKGDPKVDSARIIFSQDGVHPLPAGGDLYASAIARLMLNLKKSNSPRSENELPKPLLTNNWEDAEMIAPKEAALFSPGWEQIDPSLHGFSTYKNWFPYLMRGEKPDEGFEFTFEGSMFGFFDIGGPEVGQLALFVDGKSVKLKKTGTNRFSIVEGKADSLNRFNSFCNNRYRGQFIAIELPQGRHKVSMKITQDIPNKRKILGPNQLQDITHNPQKYNRSVIYIGKILLRGHILK